MFASFISEASNQTLYINTPATYTLSYNTKVLQERLCFFFKLKINMKYTTIIDASNNNFGRPLNSSIYNISKFFLSSQSVAMTNP